MSIEYLRRIRECEVQADMIRHDGLVESKQIVDTAINEAANLTENARLEAYALYKETLEKTDEEALSDYNKTIEQVNWECQMLLSTAQKHLDEATAVIVNKVVN